MRSDPGKVIGVLALQGAFAAHAKVLRALGHDVVLVRRASDLEALDGLVLPGGESTVQLDLVTRLGLEAPLRAALARVPVLATCAGLILVAHAVIGPSQASWDLVDVTVTRNGWGRQLDSFEGTSDRGRRVVFIRAPRITEIGAASVLDTLSGEPILVRDRNITCATFHPELTDEAELHRMVFGESMV